MVGLSKRNSDKAGLGDWYINPEKFPKGLKPLIDYVKSLGMDFGIWVEPEMVNLIASIQKSSDWVINFQTDPGLNRETNLFEFS